MPEIVSLNQYMAVAGWALMATGGAK